MTLLRSAYDNTLLANEEYADGIGSFLSQYKSKYEDQRFESIELNRQLDKKDNEINLLSTTIKLTTNSYKEVLSTKESYISSLQLDAKERSKTIEMYQNIKSTDGRAQISVQAAQAKSVNAHNFKEDKKQQTNDAAQRNVTNICSCHSSMYQQN